MSLKWSHERLVMLEAVLAHEQPFAVQELALEMAFQPALKGIPHLATLYRFLPLLEAAELVRVVRMNGSTKLYECAFERAAQHYFICSDCGVEMAGRCREIRQLETAIAERIGFELKDETRVLFGRCRACRTPKA